MNKEKISIVIAAVLVFVTVFALSGCHNAKDAATKVSADEIALQIQLDIKEDIGLLIVEYKANSTERSGGTSNADKSLFFLRSQTSYIISPTLHGRTTTPFSMR